MPANGSPERRQHIPFVRAQGWRETRSSSPSRPDETRIRGMAGYWPKRRRRHLDHGDRESYRPIPGHPGVAYAGLLHLRNLPRRTASLAPQRQVRHPGVGQRQVRPGERGVERLSLFHEPDGFRGVTALQGQARHVQSRGIVWIPRGFFPVLPLESGQLIGNIVLEDVHVAPLDDHLAGVFPQQVLQGLALISEPLGVFMSRLFSLN